MLQECDVYGLGYISDDDRLLNIDKLPKKVMTTKLNVLSQKNCSAFALKRQVIAFDAQKEFCAQSGQNITHHYKGARKVNVFFNLAVVS